MAKTHNPYISKPNELRNINPDILIRLLKTDEKFFQKCESLFPKNGSPDFKQLSALLNNPEVISKKLNEAFFSISQVATNSEIIESITYRVQDEEWYKDAGQDVTDTDFAILAHLYVPEIVADVLTRDYITKPRSFVYYIANEEYDWDFVKPSDAQYAALIQDLNREFIRWNLGPNAKVITHELDGKIFFLVRRGEKFSRQAAIDEDGESTSLFFRPENYDLLVYNPNLGEFRMNATSKWTKNLYLKSFGEHIFGSVDFFGETSRFDFSPLRKGKDALSNVETPAIEWVKLTEIQFYHTNGDTAMWEIFKSSNIFDSFEEKKMNFPEDGEIRRASFKIKIKNEKAAKTLKISSDNKEEVKDETHRALFDKWLKANKFIKDDDADEVE